MRLVSMPAMRMRLQPLERAACAFHQHRGAAGGHVEAAEELLARRLDTSSCAGATNIGGRPGSVWYSTAGSRHRLRGRRSKCRASTSKIDDSRERSSSPWQASEARRARARCSCTRRARRAAPRTGRPARACGQLEPRSGRRRAALLRNIRPDSCRRPPLRRALALGLGRPATRSRSSWYLSSTPSVSATISGSSAYARRGRPGLAQSSVSATPGCLEQLPRAQALHERDHLAREPLGAPGALRRRIASSRSKSG